MPQTQGETAHVDVILITAFFAWLVWRSVWVVVDHYRHERWRRDFRALCDEYHTLRTQREATGGHAAGQRERQLGAYIDGVECLGNAWRGSGKALSEKQWALLRRVPMPPRTQP
jgi:hypothetical protein